MKKEATYPLGEEKIYPISGLEDVPFKEVLDLFLKEQKRKGAADKMLDWQGLLIGAFLSDFLPRHNLVITKKRMN